MGTPSFQTSVDAPPKITLIEGLQEYAKNRQLADAVARDEAFLRDKFITENLHWDIEEARKKNKDTQDLIQQGIVNKREADRIQHLKDKDAQDLIQQGITNEREKARIGLLINADRRAEDEAREKARLRKIAERDATISGSLGVENILTSPSIYDSNVTKNMQRGQARIAEAGQIRDANIEVLDTRRNYLQKDGTLSPDGQKEYDTRFNYYKKFLAIPAAAEEAMKDVRHIVDTAKASTYEDTSGDLIRQLQNDYVRASQNIPLTIEEFIVNRARQLEAGGHSSPWSTATTEESRNLAKNLGLLSTADYNAKATAAMEEERARQQANIDNIAAYYKVASKRIGSSDAGMSTDDFMKMLEDLGSRDKQRGVDLLVTLQRSTNLPTPILQKAIALTAKTNTYGDNKTLDPSDPEDLKRVAGVARSLASGADVGGIVKEDFELRNLPTITGADLLGGRFNFSADDKVLSRLVLDPTVGVRDVAAERKAQAAQATAQAAQAAAQAAARKAQEEAALKKLVAQRAAVLRGENPQYGVSRPVAVPGYGRPLQ